MSTFRTYLACSLRLWWQRSMAGWSDYCRCEPNLEEHLDDKRDWCFAAAKGGKPNNWSMDTVAVVIVGDWARPNDPLFMVCAVTSVERGR
jgi:hypothetical protein